MIKPTIGRIVWYYEADIHAQPRAAIICYVWSDTCVNLAVFSQNGFAESRTSVLLWQEGHGTPRPSSYFAEWMPYQKGQAAKTEALEAKIAG